MAPPPKKTAVTSGYALLKGRYILDRLLTRRPLVAAYRAWDVTASKPVIVEMLEESLVHDPDLMPRLRQEARRASTLQQNHIVAFAGLYEDNHRVFAVREWIDGMSLAEYLSKHPTPPLYETLQVMEGIGAALQHAHKNGILHRAVNPKNIYLRYDGWVFLAGFGLPSLAGISTESEVDPCYLAPEQCSGGKIDHRADLYALATVTFTMCTGRPPFTGDASYAPGTSEWERVCWEQVHTPAPFAAKLNKDIPRSVSWVLSRALAKRPDERFRTVIEFVSVMKRAMQEAGLDTEAMLRESPGWVREPIPVGPPTIRKLAPNRPKETLFWVVGFALILVAIWGMLISIWLTRREEPVVALTTGRPAVTEQTIEGMLAMPTWTPSIIRPTDAPRLPARIIATSPTPVPAGALPYNALRPLNPEFDWNDYVDKLTWRAYTEPHFGYAIVYPGSWELTQEENVLRLYMPERDAGVIICSCGTRVADATQWANRFLDLVRRNYSNLRQVDRRPFGRWLATLAQVPLDDDDLEITVLSYGQGQRGFGVAFVAWATDWQGIKPIFDRMAREMHFP